MRWTIWMLKSWGIRQTPTDAYWSCSRTLSKLGGCRGLKNWQPVSHWNAPLKDPSSSQISISKHFSTCPIHLVWDKANSWQITEECSKMSLALFKLSELSGDQIQQWSATWFLDCLIQLTYLALDLRSWVALTVFVMSSSIACICTSEVSNSWPLAYLASVQVCSSAMYLCIEQELLREGNTLLQADWTTICPVWIIVNKSF